MNKIRKNLPPKINSPQKTRRDSFRGKRVLVFGCIGIDTIETPFGKRKNILGGSATHAALAASYFATPVIVSVIGEDFPAEHTEFLKKNRINMKNVEVKKGKTFTWQARYTDNLNEREVLSTRENVLADYSPSLLQEHKDIKYIFLANNPPASQMLILDQVKTTELVVWDTMTYWIDRYPKQILKILPRVDIALFNDSEARHFSGEINLTRAGKKILSKGVKKGVVIKKGEHGAFLFTRSFILHLPAYPLEKVKDTTGAGDSFAGGMIGFLAKTGKVNDKNLKRAMAYGTILASLTVEEFGTDRFKKSIKEEIKKRLSGLKKLIHF